MWIGFLVFLFSIILTFFIIKIAPFIGLLDHPNARRQNNNSIPTSGGIAILLTWFFGLFYLYFFENINKDLAHALFMGIPLGVVGFIDDRFDISPKFRLLIQISSAVIALWFLEGLPHISFGGEPIILGWLWSPIAFIAILWLINLYNFMDGIDGFASIEILLMSLFFFVFAGAAYNLLLFAAVAGFLIFNWSPARIYMGDVGSTVLGFTIGVLLVRYQNTGQLNLFTGLIPFTLFWFDATYTLFKRWKNGEKLTEGHKKHAYQRLVSAGYTHAQVVGMSLFINVPLWILGVFAVNFEAYVMLFFSMAICITYLGISFVNKKKPFSLD